MSACWLLDKVVSLKDYCHKRSRLVSMCHDEGQNSSTSPMAGI